MAGESNSHYFFDTRFAAFYRDTHLDTYGPTAVLNYQTDITEHRHSLAGGRDGYLRYYDDRLDMDDGESFASYVYMHPFLVGNDFREGILLEILAALAKRSGPVAYSVHMGNSHEEAFLADAFTSGTWTTDGLLHSTRLRARGFSCFVKLSNGQELRWAIETLSGIVRIAGRVRIP